MTAKRRVFVAFMLVLVICLAAASGVRTAPEPTALLAVRNYSGTAKAGGYELDKRLAETLVARMNKSGANFWNEHKPQRLNEAGLKEFPEIINLCGDEEFRRVGLKIGADRVALLEIQGYNEIRREKQGKSYQVQLSLIVLDCRGGEDRVIEAEGIGGSATNAMDNAVQNLANAYFSQPATANVGERRDQNRPVVVNTGSGRFHLPDCRHLPAYDLRRDYPTRTAAEEDGFAPCPICYPRFMSGRAFDRSVEDELGREGCGQIEYYYRVAHDPEVAARLERVAAPLVAGTTRYHVDYRFRYLDDPTINAFSAPNGYIYITRGLLEILESDDELAMVIAHEMGHIERKHAVQRYKQALALAVVGSIFAANADSSTEALMTVVAAEMVLQGFSREQEKEADEAAVSHLKRAGLDWRCYRTLMGRFIDLRERRVLPLQAIFGTHPTPESRVENLDKMIGIYERFLMKI